MHLQDGGRALLHEEVPWGPLKYIWHIVFHMGLCKHSSSLTCIGSSVYGFKVASIYDVEMNSHRSAIVFLLHFTIITISICAQKERKRWTSLKVSVSFLLDFQIRTFFFPLMFSLRSHDLDTNHIDVLFQP